MSATSCPNLVVLTRVGRVEAVAMLVTLVPPGSDAVVQPRYGMNLRCVKDGRMVVDGECMEAGPFAAEGVVGGVRFLECPEGVLEMLKGQWGERRRVERRRERGMGTMEEDEDEDEDDDDDESSPLRTDWRTLFTNTLITLVLDPVEATLARRRNEKVARRRRRLAKGGVSLVAEHKEGEEEDGPVRTPRSAFVFCRGGVWVGGGGRGFGVGWLGGFGIEGLQEWIGRVLWPFGGV
ncbi:hypothetical protein HDU67_007395 [Dinochytrium kinnereticum]|nr:hypothetical protein HDU67_007395 [Dinochytrium kinnereticum]